MTGRGWVLALVLVTGISGAGFGLFAADENAIPRQRVSPKVLKEAMNQHPVIAATAPVPHTMGRSLQDLKQLAEDLEKGGHKTEAARLNGIVKEIVRRIESDISEKKSQISRLNTEIEELKWAANQ